MGLRIDHRRVRNQVKFAVRGRQIQSYLALDQALALAAILDNVLDRAHLEIVPIAKLPQVRYTSHAPVRIDNLANDRGSLETGQARQIDAPFGVPGADHNAAFPCPQAWDMAFAPDEVVGSGARVDLPL